jgi:hypothetical protein
LPYVSQPDRRPAAERPKRQTGRREAKNLVDLEKRSDLQHAIVAADLTRLSTPTSRKNAPER